MGDHDAVTTIAPSGQQQCAPNISNLDQQFVGVKLVFVTNDWPKIDPNDPAIERKMLHITNVAKASFLNEKEEHHVRGAAGSRPPPAASYS